MEGGGKRKQEDKKQEHQENPRKNNNAHKFICDFSSPVNFLSYLRPEPWFKDGVIELSKSYDRNQINPQKETPTLGLALEISTSIINQLELSLSQASQQNGHQAQGLRLSPHRHKSHSKATSIHALSLKIGNWEWKSKNPGDLTAKFYYGTKKLVWEVLCGSLKKKIEIRWSHISAINAYVDGKQTSHLEIELNEHPKLSEEINFNPKSRTQWVNTAHDFTGDQTRICRRHTITFPLGVLNDPFKTLLKCDKSLADLIQQPFPYQNSPFFQHEHIHDFSCNRSIQTYFPNNDHHGTSVPYAPTSVQPVRHIVGHSCSKLPPTVLKSPSPTPFIQTRELDNILPNLEMDSGILDDQLVVPDLLETYKMNDAEFTNQEKNFKTNPIHQRNEINPMAANNDGHVFEEHNSCIRVEASVRMDDSLIQLNNHSAYVDDEMFSFGDPFTFQEPFNMHEFSYGDEVNQVGLPCAAAADDNDCGELFVFQNS